MFLRKRTSNGGHSSPWYRTALHHVWKGPFSAYPPPPPPHCSHCLTLTRECVSWMEDSMVRPLLTSAAMFLSPFLVICLNLLCLKSAWNLQAEPCRSCGKRLLNFSSLSLMFHFLGNFRSATFPSCPSQQNCPLRIHSSQTYIYFNRYLY